VVVNHGRLVDGNKDTKKTGPVDALADPDSIYTFAIAIITVRRRPLRKGNNYIGHFPVRGSALN
jgi:hypothetical protein